MKAAQITTIVTTLYGFNQCVIKQVQFDVLVTTDTILCKHMLSASHTEDVDNRQKQVSKLTFVESPYSPAELPLLSSQTSEQRTLWKLIFCPLFGSCPYLGGSMV